jgi:hypothetical protein
MSLGAAMAGGNPDPERGRVHDDFYPTPWDVTQALLEVESFEGLIWEPCCGDWAMAGVLEDAGYKVIGSDLSPRASRGIKRDAFSVTKPVAHNVVTNPPFQFGTKTKVQAFIEHLMKMPHRKVALMLKSSYWHAKERLPIFDVHRPAWIYPLTWRPDFKGLGRPTMEVMWCVWHRGNTDWPRYRPLERPAKLPCLTEARRQPTGAPMRAIQGPAC